METGTLKELNVKPGDVVECVSLGRNGSNHYVTVGKRYTINPNRSYTDDGGEINFGFSEAFRIISRASDTPKTWGDMTDAEKGALLLAAHEGKVIEQHQNPSAGLPGGWFFRARPTWMPNGAYRVRPEPVRETVTLYGRATEPNSWAITAAQWDNDTHRITFTTENGKPDCTKCPTCGTAKHVDMEEI
jgi:hypothetical protein